MGSSDILNKIGDIVDGHLKELIGYNEELHMERMAICRACPLFIQTAVGPRCNPDKAILNEDGKRLTKGCGCRLDAKTRKENQKCPAGKW